MSAFLISSEIAFHELDHLPDLAFGQLISKWNHPVSAVGDMLIDLLVSRVFEFAFAQVWDLFSIFERFPFRFGAVADGAILSKDRGFVGRAFGDRKTLRRAAETASRRTRKYNNYQ
jgi:hypothetical protein